MTELQHRAAVSMYRVLLMRGQCVCEREFPYGGKLVRECTCCAARRAWEEAQLDQPMTKDEPS